MKRFVNLKIPDDFDYAGIISLSNEARQKLIKVRPGTIAQASHIPGLTPADIQLLWISIESFHNFKKKRP